MPMELQEFQIASKYDRNGRLVLMDGSLIAVLAKLSDVHADLTVHWFLETGYGALRNKQPTFPDLQAAIVWIEAEVGRNCCPE
jgi:hypothetical protein